MRCQANEKLVELCANLINENKTLRTKVENQSKTLRELQKSRSVVHCSECIFLNPDGCYFWKQDYKPKVKPDDFCSYAERKDNV